MDYPDVSAHYLLMIKFYVPRLAQQNSSVFLVCWPSGRSNPGTASPHKAPKDENHHEHQIAPPTPDSL
jgi:hypothetical protein